MLSDGRTARIPVVFYRTRSGTEVVRDWLKSLPGEDRAIMGQDLMRIQFRWPVGMPFCRAMGNGLWEVRSDLPTNRIARILFCVIGGKILILNGFVKKTQKAPSHEIELALERKREFER